MQDLTSAAQARGYPVGVRGRRLLVLLLLASCRRPALPGQQQVNVDAGSGLDTGGADGIADSRLDVGGIDARADTIPDARPDAAGCRSNDDCHPALEFCRKSSCAADARGACAPRPGTRDAGGLRAARRSGVRLRRKHVFVRLPRQRGRRQHRVAWGVSAARRGWRTRAPPTTSARRWAATTATGPPAATRPGTCEPRARIRRLPGRTPHAVCGCDHLNYASLCGAASYGTSIALDGRCPPSPDGP